MAPIEEFQEEETPASVKDSPVRGGTYLARLLLVLLWLGMAFVALEFWVRLEAWRGMAGNPYIQAWTEGKPWPFHDLDPSQFGPRTAPERTGAAAAPETLWKDRAAWFAALPDTLRGEFARVFHLGALELDAEMRIQRTYPELERWRALLPLPFEIGQDIRAALPNGSEILRAALDASAAPPSVSFAPLPLTDGLPFDSILCRIADDGGKVFLFFRLPDRNPEEPWWEVPGFIYGPHGARKDSPFFLNNRGFRGSDIAVPKPEGIVRIAFIGGSTTEEGPINDFTYPALTGRLLRERFGLDAVEAVNCGASGTTTFHHLSRLPDYLALEPDMLVFYVGTNDVVKRLFPMWLENAGVRERLTRHSLLMRRYCPNSVLPAERRMRDDMCDVTIANLEIIAAQAKTRGIEVAICSFAHPAPALLTPAERAYYEATRFDFDGMDPAAADAASSAMSFGAYIRAIDLLNEELREFCTRTGAVYIPVAETVRGGAIVFGDICHMKNYGIMAKAECVARSLAPVVKECAGEKNPAAPDVNP